MSIKKEFKLLLLLLERLNEETLFINYYKPNVHM